MTTPTEPDNRLSNLVDAAIRQAVHDAQPAPKAAEPVSDAVLTGERAKTAVALVRFLNGEAPLEGKWFGEKDGPNGFWWRKYLPSLLSASLNYAAPVEQAAQPKAVALLREARRRIVDDCHLANRIDELLEELAQSAYNNPPCQECGAATLQEAERKCHGSSDKDDCHGCRLWPEGSAPSAPLNVGADRPIVLSEDLDLINRVLRQAPEHAQAAALEASARIREGLASPSPTEEKGE